MEHEFNFINFCVDLALDSLERQREVTEARTEKIATNIYSEGWPHVLNSDD